VIPPELDDKIMHGAVAHAFAHEGAKVSCQLYQAAD
jgi:hypothetical protein